MIEAPRSDNGEHEAISKFFECFMKFWDVALFLYKGLYLESQKSTESLSVFVQTKFIRPYQNLNLLTQKRGGTTLPLCYPPTKPYSFCKPSLVTRKRVLRAVLSLVLVKSSICFKILTN